MNTNEAKTYINNHPGHILQPDGQSESKNEGATDYGYVCPICGSGSGEKGTGMKRDPKHTDHMKCFACGFYGDMIELLATRDGLKNAGYIDQLKHACQLYNIELDSAKDDFLPQTTPQPAPSLTGPKDKPLKDYSANYQIWKTALKECDYLTQRGISEFVQDAKDIGFCKAFKNGRDALIIPNGPHSYIARFLDDGAEKYNKAGPNTLYNADALEMAYNFDTPCFVVEGEIDALSFIELVHFNVVALGSATNYRKLIEALKNIEEGRRPFLVLALDNDQAGQENTLKLREELDKLGADYIAPSKLYGNFKDANECLLNEREAFDTRIEALNKSPEELYSENSADHLLNDFLADIENGRNQEPITTGFFKLSDALDGGLYAGLYVIGAISSLGKTTFTLQMADAIAQSGEDVIIFSLEMSKKEMIAKSISRLSLIGMKPGQITAELARSTRDLLSNTNRNNARQLEVIRESVKTYREYAGNIFIFEGLGDVDIDRIRATVANHVLRRHKTPVIVVDYLQIIAPYEPKATDKQNTDKAVLELKRLSRDYCTPVLAISSFNRDNYKEAVNMTAFKESGAIEYSSDVLIGLQLKGAGDKGFNAEEAKKKSPREVELKVLKNRNGGTGARIEFDYFPIFNYFEEF